MATITQKQAKLDPTPSLHFPTQLMDPSYDGKRMYIRIYKSKTFKEISAIIKKGVSRDITKAEKAVGQMAANNWSGSVDTLLSIPQEIVVDLDGHEEMILALPLPNELQDTQSHSFDTSTGMVRDLIDGSAIAGKISKVMAKVAANTSSQKILANPGYFQNYTGSEPRQFSFSFKLIPNSLEEAEIIQGIIIILKKYASPSLHNGAIMMAPRFFWFNFSNPILQNLTGIRPCVITNISTNYAGSGILETTFDGMPKYIELSISISELRTITFDKW